MNPSEPNRPDLEARLARALGPKPETLPSPGFATSVMRSVRAEAVAQAGLAPLAFPWRRIAPGLALSLGLVAVALSLVPWGEAGGPATDSLVHDLTDFARSPGTLGAALAASWVAFGLLLTLAGLRAGRWVAAGTPRRHGDPHVPGVSL